MDALTTGRVRTAVAADAPEMAAIHVRTWRDEYRGQLPDGLLDGLDVVARARDWTGWLAGEGVFLVHEDGGALTGFAAGGAARGGPPGVGELYALYVSPPAQGRGTGHALWTGMTVALVERGFHAMMVWVLAGNRRARAFYERRGARRAGQRIADVHGAKVAEVSYELALR